MSHRVKRWRKGLSLYLEEMLRALPPEDAERVILEHIEMLFERIRNDNRPKSVPKQKERRLVVVR